MLRIPQPVRSHAAWGLSIRLIFCVIRYPNHSLLRFLLVSNSLDLILDVILELWSAIVGEICLQRLVLIMVTIFYSRFRSSICSQGNIICTYHWRCWGQAYSLRVGPRHVYRPSFFCASWSFAGMAHTEVLWTNPWPVVLFYPLQVSQASGHKWGAQRERWWTQESRSWQNS